MELEFKKYILKKYGVSIPSLFRNTLEIGKTLEINMTNFLNTLDELDVLLRIKKQPIKLDDNDIKWLNNQQKERLNKCLKVHEQLHYV